MLVGAFVFGLRCGLVVVYLGLGGSLIDLWGRWCCFRLFLLFG